MLYNFSLTIPANTTRESPEEKEINLASGIITKVMVRPRPGHAALAHLVIMLGAHQLFPNNAAAPIWIWDPLVGAAGQYVRQGWEGTFHGDTFPIDWEDFYELTEAPIILRLSGWNEDDTYPHTFDVAFAILPKWVAIPYAIAKAFTDLAKLLSPLRIFGRK